MGSNDRAHRVTRVTLRFQQAGDALQRQRVALHPAAGDHAGGDGRDVGMAAEGLALVDVGDVDLDDRAGEGGKRVKDGDRGVAVAGGVDDDRRRALARLVDPVDELVFAVALAEVDGQAMLGGGAAAERLDVGERSPGRRFPAGACRAGRGSAR